LAVLTLFTFLAAACGARVSDEQVRSAGSATGGGTSAQSADAGTVAGPGDATAAGSGDSTATTAPATGAGASSGGSATPAAGAAGAGSAAPAAPAGGNGGATDVGVTADSVTLGNVSTLSGPVPGLFQGAVIGSQAAVAYQNSKGGLFGRKFKLQVRDDQFDTGQNRSQTLDLIKNAFAFVGSFSLYDDAGAAQIQGSGIPDVTYSLTDGRRKIPNNFSIAPAPPGAPTGAFNYFKRKFPNAVGAVGTIYSEVSKTSHDDYKAAAQANGWKYVYERGVQATETDFTADVVRMRQSGVKGVYLVAVDVKTAARLAKAMSQQNFKPEFFIVNGAGYDAQLFSLAGSAVEGMFNSQPYAMFAGEDAGSIPEVKLFNEWLQKVKPGYKPDLFAAYGWASGRLLFQAMEAAGPKVTRAGVIDALRKINEFSDNGMLAPAGPGAKRPASCFIVLQVKGGKFTRFDSPPPGYRCGDGPYFSRQK
jgi:ABC-type branched-subunit amino acid transport system substrate-binding protein